MTNPFPIVRWLLRWERHRLRRMIGRLRRREGTLSFQAEQGGPHAAIASALAADLGCILTDHMAPAADALERAARSVEPLPEDETAGEGEAA